MYPKQLRTVFSASVLCMMALLLFFGCRSSRKVIDPAFAKYVEAYTTGIISKQSPIRIQLAGQSSEPHAQNEEVNVDLFDFSPSIKGKAYWVDASTIEFRPNENMVPGKAYTATFKLSKVIKDVPSELSSFDFDFQVIKPAFSVEDNGLKAWGNTSLDRMSLSGVVYTADVEDPQIIEKLLTNQYDGKRLAITWQHNPAGREHKFTIGNIPRGNQAKSLNLQWNGKELGIESSGARNLDVPAIGDFKVLDVRPVYEPEQYLLVQFSDPLNAAQSLDGMLGITGISDLRFSVEGSEVKVFTPERLEGKYNLAVNEGVLNVNDKRLDRAFGVSVVFENRQPSVSIPGNGVIMPSTGKLVLPFDAVNLNAVDVSVIKIYEKNIPQYLQRNSLNGDNELRRVGTPVVQKTIRLDLDRSLNLHRKNRFNLDLEKILRTEPGAIYRVTIGFRRSYSLAGCNGKEAQGDQASSEDEEGSYYGEKLDEDDEFWSRYDSYYPYGYNWEERESPCSNSYYNKNKWASRNILSSNIGLIAKRGNDNSMLVAVTDIRDAKPLSGVELELLDYQGIVLEKGKSDGDGIATFQLKRKPYLLIAKKDAERGYLKLDDGSSLPLSRFDVKGEEVQSGIKGFIYGERGVWRPGDSLYLTFVLEDKDNKLPDNHPVTMELYNPKGQLYRRITQNQSLNGFYKFHTYTESEAITGSYSAKVKVGGATFTKNVRVETVKPNRLKIKVDFGSEILRKSSTGTLSAMWLFGATAQNLKAKVDVSLTSGNTSFKKFDGYHFDDMVSSFSVENKTIFEGSLGESGSAPLSTSLNVEKQAPGVLNANFEVKVFEPGGDFSIDHFSMPYHVFNSYVGIRAPEGDRLTGMLVTGKDHVVSLVNVDVNGNAVSGTRTVEVSLYKERWRWWWDENEADYSNFFNDSYNQFLGKQLVTLVNGKGTYSLRIDQPDWGRYVIRVKDPESGHAASQSVYVDWPDWANRMAKENPGEAAMLVFNANKTKYNVGETVTLTIPSSEGGRALISIESGSKVLKTDWIGTNKGQTVYTFKAEANMAPNVYVNISLLQPHAQTANDLPIRMYGTVPILVEDPNTILQPTIKMADKLRPEEKASITVGETNGKAMTYTIAIVDEGLLDLTRFKTPDPHSAFYAREALGVKTWDLFDYVIGAWGTDLERILSIGGDEGLNKNASGAKANRFKPVVTFMGPFYLKKGDKQTHQFQLPPYIGSVKAMVVAGHEGAYGKAEKVVAVKKPLMLLTSLPRVLGPTETVQVPVTVFGLEPHVRNVNVTIAPNALFDVVGERTKTITFNQPGEQMVYFDVQVRALAGVGKVTFTATSGKERAEETVELEVRNPNPYISNVIEAVVEPGQNWSSAYSPVGMSGTNTGTLEVSSIPPLNLGKRLNYLIQYPHGCVEQTTSSVFPQLTLGSIIELSPNKQAEIDKNVKAGINRLKSFQLSDGGLGYWPGAAESDEWGTNYAGHFMLEAQQRGYALPAGFLEQWKKYQRNKAVAWTVNSRNFYGADLDQAYRLYLLALAKAPEVGAMNRLKEFQYLSVPAKWRLAMAYQLAGQAEAATSLVKGLGTEVKPYTQLGGTYGSDLRDRAMILEALTLMKQRNSAGSLLRQVAADLSKDSWYSTQTTAYALIAIARYCGDNKPGGKMNAGYTLNGTSGNLNSVTYLAQVPITFRGTAGGNAGVTNRGQGPLFVRLILEGQPETGQNPYASNDPEILTMDVQYKNRNGQSVDPSSLRQGTDFVATVTMRNPGRRGYYEQMALTQVFPSGWEIINTRLMGNDSTVRVSPFTYQDIRDDRVYTYFNLEENKTVTYQVLLNAAYTGRYYLPATAAEAMYDNSIHAFVPGKWVEVIK
ncbi:MG2 domain-containing protein [Chitinophaga horti]|uniref:MG2 domain-containing protein n=1 Tax=Chitinophaga horti TaxID=2920382 RepID=A0ABY6IXX5_9BACT|nr:MG2 domain-containing protein [Chitinophaga horti]UYQ92238.1 MG2 domain-containing protein [Chitinophaga horti]